MALSIEMGTNKNGNQIELSNSNCYINVLYARTTEAPFVVKLHFIESFWVHFMKKLTYTARFVQVMLLNGWALLHVQGPYPYNRRSFAHKCHYSTIYVICSTVK